MAMIISVGEVSANEVETADSIATQQLENVTVTAVKSKAKVSTTTSVQMLSGEELRSLGVQIAGDAMKRFAGSMCAIMLA